MYKCLVVIGVIFGFTIWQMYSNATKKIEKIIVARVTKEFEEPAIKAIVQKVAENQAAQILKDEVLPYIENFQADVNAELKKVQTATDTPSLTLMRDRIRTVKDESGYTTSLVFRPSNRQSIGSTAFVARITGNTDARIKEFGKIGVTEGVIKSISRNGKEAIYNCNIQGYVFPELKLVTTGPAIVQLYGAHLSGQPVMFEVKHK